MVGICRRSPQRVNTSLGFTLIELMIAIAVLGALLSLAVPSFTQMIKTQKVRTFATELHGDLTFARAEAIKRNADVVLAPKDTTTGTKEWSKGWDVTTISGTNTLTLKTMDSREGQVLASATGVESITYGAAGRLKNSAATIAITVKDNDLPSSNWRCVSVNIGGRAAINTGGCS